MKQMQDKCHIDKKVLDFWKDIIYKDGVLNEEQVLKELNDFYFIMQQVPKVYDHITKGRLSKLMYEAATVISEADAVQSEDYICKEDLLEFIKDN